MKKWSKKCIVLVLAMCIMLLGSMSTFAATKEEATPYYVALMQLSTSLNISSSGYASCTGEAFVRPGYTADVTLALQQKDGSTWDTIKTWTSSGKNVSFDKGYFVADETDYRLKITANVYDSNDVLVESPYAYTKIVTFSP